MLARLVAIAFAAALALVGAAHADAPARCFTSHACDARIAPGGLALDRGDGSRLHVARRARLICSAWEPGVAAPSIHLVVGRVRRASSFWTFDAVRSTLRRRRTFAFPTSVLDAHPRGAILFARDGATLNELSSQEEEAHGSLTVTRARCTPRPELAFTVSGRLGSEFFGDPGIRVRGRVRVVGRARH